ncbi:hypothetical protein JCM8547_008800 [Rhodosporidiobolus lusitaniae]
MARQFEPVQPEPPPLEFFSFLVPLFIQCLLLHPCFPPRLSRFLRFILTPLSLSLSLTAPYRFAFEPRNQAVGVNFVLGIAGAYGSWKAVEWGLAEDLTPYAWVGFEEEEKEDGSSTEDSSAGEANGGGNGTGEEVDKKDKKKKKPSAEERRAQKKARHAYLLTLRSRQARFEGPLQVLLSTFHLLIAMRGEGYEFSGTSTLPFPHSTEWEFFRRLAMEIAWSHPLLVSCAALLLEPPTSRDAFLSFHLFPSFLSQNPTYTHYAGEVITGFSMGIAVFAALTLGYSVATMLVFLPNVLLRRVFSEASRLMPKKFDAREYPPLFNFAKRPQSVAVFWSKQWHSFFSRPFRFLAFDPLHRLISPLFGPLVSRPLGVLAVFALSSWLHEFGLSSATSHLSLSPRPLPPNLPFLIRWGGSVYFMSQGLAIILEGAFTAVTGRRVKGWCGTGWTVVFVVGVGGVLVKAWLTLGLLREVPPLAYWSWQRAVLPLGCLMPPPMWMREVPESYGFERHA